MDQGTQVCSELDPASCHRFVANQVRAALFIPAYSLWNVLRRLCLPKAMKHWSLRSLQVKLIKLG